MASRRIAILVAVVIGAATAGTASASGPTAAEKETARALMDEGHARVDRGDNKGALESFRAADALMNVPTTALEVARQQVALGLLVDARDTLLRLRRMPPGGPAPFAVAREKAQAMYDELTTRIPSLRLSVSGVANLETAKIAIDGTTIPAAAIGVPFKVNPGHHVVSVTSESGGHVEVETDVAEGAVKGVDLTVSASPANATVGAAPPPSEAPRAAPAANGETGSATSATSGPVWLRWGGAGLAVIGAGVGATTGIVSLSSTHAAAAHCQVGQCPPSTWGDLNTAHTTATISDVAFAAAGVGVLAFVSSFFFTTSSPVQPPPTAAVRVVPWVGPTTAGVSATF